MTLDLPDLLIEPIVRAALSEDLGRAGDVTVAACLDPEARLNAAFVSRQNGVVAGLACVRLAILALDPAASITFEAADGDVVGPGSVLARGEEWFARPMCPGTVIAPGTTVIIADIERGVLICYPSDEG